MASVIAFNLCFYDLGKMLKNFTNLFSGSDYLTKTVNLISDRSEPGMHVLYGFIPLHVECFILSRQHIDFRLLDLNSSLMFYLQVSHISFRVSQAEILLYLSGLIPQTNNFLAL